MKTFPILKSSQVQLAGHRRHVPLLLALCLAAGSASAATEQWLGVPGVSDTTNWTDAANWSPGVQQTYYNQVQFTGTGANANTDFSVNNVLDATTGVAQMPIWQLDFIPLNGNYTTLINPGVTLTTGAGNGTLTVGADILNNSSPAAADAVETITLTGEGGALNVGGNMYIGQGSPTPGDAHNVTLDLSGLDRFTDTGSLIFVAGGNLQRANGTLYLAKNNQISLGNNFRISSQTYSNSLPCAVYLGQANTITLGSGDLTVAGTGTSSAGAWMKFNPAFVSGDTMPAASFNGSRSDGRIASFNICNENGGPFISGYGLCDFTGGSVTMLVDSMQLGQAGPAGADALGVLTLDDGTVDVNNAVIGLQSSTSGGAGAGIVNLNSNSIAGANATLRVNNTLTLAAVTGTLTAGTAGTININGGALIANTITNGGGDGAINLTGGSMTLTGVAGSMAAPISRLAATNAVFNLSLITNSIVASSLETGGATNIINILSAPPIASYPVQIPLIKYSGSLGGAGFNFGLGTLPPLYAGHLVNNTANSSIDILLTAGSSTLTWNGSSSGDWDTTTANWTSGGSPAIYGDGDFVQFLDGANNNTVNLTGGFLPAAIIVSNTSPVFTFTGGGYLDGSGGLVKQGSGALVLDNSGYNVYAGGTVISGGTLQVGNNDANGNLPSGPLTDNASLVFARTDGPTVDNNISGTGSFTQAGAGGALVLSGNNTFTGDVLVTNNSALKLGSASALGGGSGPVVIANGSTLDINGVYGSRPIVVSGNGVDGNGAITDNGGAVYGLTSSVTLTGDTTFGYPSRWDLINATLSTGGNPYNLTLAGNGTGSYLEWNSLAIDPALNDINIASVNLGLKGSTSLGNPDGTLVLTPNGALTFYNPNVSINKQVDFQANSTINVGGGDHVMAGAMTLESGYCMFNLNGGTSLTLSNVLSGDGTIYLNGGPGSLILAGNSPSYTGDVSLYNGTVMLNGLIGGTLSSQSATTVAGNGKANGLVDISGDLQPGKAGVAGTFHAQGGLTLEGGATLTSDLSASTASGNDLVQVDGDLTLNGNTFNINPTGGGLANGTYTLITYTGNFNGSLGTAMTTFATAYSLVLNNVTTTTPKQIQLIVTGNSQSSQLVWNNASASGQWDVQSSANWSNVTTQVSSDVFHYLDSVRFDDSILNAAFPETNVVIPSGQIVVPRAITADSTLNYTISGAGKISGATGLTKLGGGTLALNVPGDFTGPVIIGGGTLQTTGNNPLASVSSITVSNNGTFDFAGNAYNRTNPIVISGTGANGVGAIINSGGTFYDTLLNIVLAGDALVTENPNGRWDFTYGSSISGAHHLTINANGGYGEMKTTSIASNVAGIIITNGQIGLQHMENSCQSPATLFTIANNTQLTIWSGGFNGSLYLMPGAQVNVYSGLPLTFTNGSALSGIGGAVNGDLVIGVGATISPSSASTGVATGGINVSGNVTLNGMTVLKLNGSGTSDFITAAGNITYGGTLALTNISDSPLVAGDSFQLFNTAKNFSGTFSGATLPTLNAGLAWDLSQLNSGLVKVIGGGTGPVIGGPTVANGKLIFNGTGGTANGTYYVLTTTNLAAPLAQWTPVQTNQFDTTGAFSVTNTLDPAAPQLFYRIQQP